MIVFNHMHFHSSQFKPCDITANVKLVLHVPISIFYTPINER